MLAKAVDQLALMLCVPPSSRASPAPTGPRCPRTCCPAQFPCGGLLAKAVDQLALMLCVPPSSRASPAPTGPRCPRICCPAQFPCGSEPARDDVGSACIDVVCAAVIAGKPGSHRPEVPADLLSSSIPLWGLARESGGSACIDVVCAAVIAGKPGSHRPEVPADLLSSSVPLWERACSRKRWISLH